jgi:hypothetical protein
MVFEERRWFLRPISWMHCNRRALARLYPILASVDFEKTVVQTIWGNQARTPEYKEERE